MTGTAFCWLATAGNGDGRSQPSGHGQHRGGSAPPAPRGAARVHGRRVSNHIERSPRRSILLLIRSSSFGFFFAFQIERSVSGFSVSSFFAENTTRRRSISIYVSLTKRLMDFHGEEGGRGGGGEPSRPTRRRSTSRRRRRRRRRRAAAAPTRSRGPRGPTGATGPR